MSVSFFIILARQVISMDDPPGVRAIIPFRATAPGDAAYNAQSVCFEDSFVKIIEPISSDK